MTLIHLDTIVANQMASTPYNNTFNLNYPIKGCSECIFKGIELPVQIPNIRANSELNVIKFINNSVTYSVTIVESIYTDIATLITVLNSSFTSQLGSTGIQMVASVTSSNLINLNLTITATNDPTFSLVPTNFSKYILGFKTTANSITIQNQHNSNLTSNLTYNLQVDNYIYLHLSNLVTKNVCITNQNFNNVSFKIPLNATSNIVYFSSNETTFKQSIFISPEDIYDYITVKFFDRFGCQLVGNTYPDYSLTLEVI